MPFLEEAPGCEELWDAAVFVVLLQPPARGPPAMPPAPLSSELTARAAVPSI